MPRSRISVRPSPAVENVEPGDLLAGAPNRATGNLILGFGTTAIPCNVYSGTQDNSVKRSEHVVIDATEATPTYAKVGRATINKDSGATVESSDVVRLAEATDGTLVPLSDDEIAAAIGCEGGACTIEKFLPLSVMNAGTYIVDSLYQLRPAPARSGGSNRRSVTTEQAFALLIKAMRLEGTFALCMVALRGKPRYAAFMPDGRLYTLRFTSEVRLPLGLPDSEASDEDLMLARMLVAAHTSNVAPTLRDSATAKVVAFVDSKAAGMPHTSVEALTPDRTYEDFIAGLRAQVRGMALSEDVMPGSRPERVESHVPSETGPSFDLMEPLMHINAAFTYSPIPQSTYTTSSTGTIRNTAMPF